MLDIHQLFLDRLQQQGIYPNNVAPFLRDLSKIFESNPGIDLMLVNSKLQLLGWNGVAVDYQSLQLALAWIEQSRSNLDA